MVLIKNGGTLLVRVCGMLLTWFLFALILVVLMAQSAHHWEHSSARSSDDLPVTSL